MLHELRTPTRAPAPLGSATTLRPAPPRGAWRLLSKSGWLWTRLATDVLLLVAAILAARLGAPAELESNGEVAVWLLLGSLLWIWRPGGR